MSEPNDHSPASGIIPRHERVFLAVVDKSPEMRVALRYACQRALKTGGRVALLYVIEPGDFQNWMGVEALMKEEQRQEAEQVLQKLAADVQKMSGQTPVLYLREGNRRDELLKLIAEEPRISVLVLGASAEAGEPGPLVSTLAGKMSGRLRVPITVVPGSLTDDEVDALT